MSKNFFWIGLSIAYWGQGEYEKAADAIKSAAKTAYQDISRTQAPCIMFFEAVATGNEQLRRESKKILNSRLRVKGSNSAEFAKAKFLTNKIDSNELLNQKNEYKADSLRCKHTAAALFYIAVKCYDNRDIDGCKKNLHKVLQLYDENTVVTSQFEFYLAQMWLINIQSPAEMA